MTFSLSFPCMSRGKWIQSHLFKLTFFFSFFSASCCQSPWPIKDGKWLVNKADIFTRHLQKTQQVKDNWLQLEETSMRSVWRHIQINQIQMKSYILSALRKGLRIHPYKNYSGRQEMLYAPRVIVFLSLHPMLPEDWKDKFQGHSWTNFNMSLQSC